MGEVNVASPCNRHLATKTMEIVRNAAGNPLYPIGTNIVDEDTNFVAGDSPHVIDVKTTLGKNGNWGYFIVDGTGSILVEIAHSGSNYETQFTVKTNEVVGLMGRDVSKVRLTHSGTDSAYRFHMA